MTDCLDLVRAAEIEHTVQAGAHGKASGICLGDSECAELPAVLSLHLVGFRIEHIIRLAEEPVLAIADARGEIQVLGKREVRKPDLEIVCHSVLELVQEALFHELGRLEINLVLECCAVAEGEFLVEFLFADAVFLLERIESADAEVDIRECEHIGTVLSVLAVVHTDCEVEFSVPVASIRD